MDTQPFVEPVFAPRILLSSLPPHRCTDSLLPVLPAHRAMLTLVVAVYTFITFMGCAFAQQAQFEFFPLYDGMDRAYTVKRFNYEQLKFTPKPEVYDLYEGVVTLRVLTHEYQQDRIVWRIRQEMDVNYTPLNTPPTRISGVDTVRLIEIDSGRHELLADGVSSRAGLAFPWNFPYRDDLRSEAEAVHLFRDNIGPPSYVFSSFKDVGVGGSLCRIRFIRDFGIDSLYTDRYTGRNYDIIYSFRAQLIGSPVDSAYLGMLRADSVRRDSIRADSVSRAAQQLGFTLFQNFPNPSTGTTAIEYSIPRKAHVTIRIYDVRGREVATVVDQERAMGRHQEQFTPDRLSSGVYVIGMNAEGNYRARVMLYMK